MLRPVIWVSVGPGHLCAEGEGVASPDSCLEGAETGRGLGLRGAPTGGQADEHSPAPSP